MSPTVISFIKSSLAYLAIGVTLGILMAIKVLPDPRNIGLITTAHAHINLMGTVMMLIYGVGYHILPRFSGRPLYSEGLASAQLWINNIGLAGMAVTRLVGAYIDTDIMRIAIAPFGIVYAIGAYIFVYNLWKTIAAATPAPTPPGAGGVPQKPAG
ncbi:MAG: cbb3-type cytochrome c oxidase subunit I [Actinomycetota bacterium]